MAQITQRKVNEPYLAMAPGLARKTMNRPAIPLASFVFQGFLNNRSFFLCVSVPLW